MSITDWDTYFYNICDIVAKKSNCLSRNIGAVLVKDKVIVATGYNGPPRGVSHCGDLLQDCPRRLARFKSGEGLHLCPAAHAEQNCIANAARVGVNTSGTKMYMTCEVPCTRCLGSIINAGIEEIICVSGKYYDDLADRLLKESGLKMRKFNIREVKNEGD